jgi:hypothetical protein
MNGSMAIANGRNRQIRVRLTIGHLLCIDTLRRARPVSGASSGARSHA